MSEAKTKAILAGKYSKPDPDDKLDIDDWKDDEFTEEFEDAPKGPKMVVAHMPDGRTFIRSEGVVKVRMAQMVQHNKLPEGEADFGSEV